MNLNGGYIMLDLDDTASLNQNNINTILNSGKPLMVLKDGKASFATLDYSGGSIAYICLSNDVKYEVNVFSHSVSVSNVTLKTYRHIGVFKYTIGSTEHTFTCVIENTTTVEQSSVPNIFQAIYNGGFKSKDNSMLITDSVAGVALVYVTLGNTVFEAHIKPLGENTYSATTNGTFVSDTMVKIS